MNDTLVNATTSVAASGVQYGQFAVSLETILTAVNYLLIGLLGFMIGILFLAIWYPTTRAFIMRQLGNRMKMFKWDIIIIKIDRGAQIEVHVYNKHNQLFAEIGNDAYYFSKGYLKYELGVPVYMFADRDARTLTTLYEKVLDKQGRIIYDVFKNNHLLPNASYEITSETEHTARDENGNIIMETVLKERLKPYVWLHRDLYPPQLVDPEQLMMGIKLNRESEAIKAENNAAGSKWKSDIILIGVIIITVISIMTAWTLFGLPPKIDNIQATTEIIRNQTQNITAALPTRI